jgi:hypothetical protein
MFCSVGLHNIEEFKTRRLKQKRNACPSISICDSEEDQLDDTLLADLVSYHLKKSDETSVLKLFFVRHCHVKCKGICTIK